MTNLETIFNDAYDWANHRFRGMLATLSVGGVAVDATHPLPTSDVIANGTKAFGEIQGSATAAQMPTLACRMVRFKAQISNAGNVYVGGATVTKPNGTTDTTTGFELTPGDDSGWLPCANLNEYYRICDNAGDDLTFIAVV